MAMINRLSGAVKWFRTNTYLSRNEEQLWDQIAKGSGTSIEFPALRIEQPQYIKIGFNSSIGRNAWLACYDKFQDQQFTPTLTIGNNVRIGNYACITVVDHVSIGDGSLFSDYVYISDHSHDLNPLDKEPLAAHPLVKGGSVVVGRNTFIGMRVALLPGVSIGDFCVVGAGSVVTHSYPSYSMIAGSPARLIKKFSLERNEWVSVSVNS